MKKTILAVALVVFFVMALAVPAFAMSMNHTKQVDLDATSIDWELQAGHLCNTGAELKQTIMGSGVLEKTMTTTQVKGKLTVDDKNTFVAGATNLAVISVIELCAPPKFTYDDADGITAVVHPSAIYGHGYQPYTFGPHVFGDIPFGPGNESYESFPTYEDWDAVSRQIWAAHVNADPGFSGRLDQNFEAAYGGYAGLQMERDEDGVLLRNGLWDAEASWAGIADRWRWEARPGGAFVQSVGPRFVGDHFNITQFMRTSQGAVQRFIDISSPWSGAYVSEDMTVVGKSEIQETFGMTNLPQGADIPGDWWNLF